MSKKTAAAIAEPSLPDTPRYLPGLLLLFIGSGCAALIYEVVWFQLLQLVIGSSAVSLGVLLGTYMGGMCLGSLLLPRFIRAKLHPLRVYSAIELGIGICAILVLFVLPLMNSVYAAIAGHGVFGIVLRAVIAAICLLPPTLLMGASLPAIARWVETTPKGVSWLGFFYGGNIAGAVLGCLLAGFYLLRVYDMPTATVVAVSINFAVALISFYLAKKTRYAPVETVDPDDWRDGSHPRETARASSRTVYIAIAISGACALGAEVVWTRLLSLMLGATVYTFSIILAVFLIGLGIGSAVGVANVAIYETASGWRWRCVNCCSRARSPGPLIRLRSRFRIGRSIRRYRPVRGSPSSSICCAASGRFCLPAILWGASFPLALAAAAWRGEDGGKLVGEVYAANTVGAILGAVGFSIVRDSVGGHAEFAAGVDRAGGDRGGCCVRVAEESAGEGRWISAVAVAAMAAVWLITSVAPVPWLAIAYGRRMLTTSDPGKVSVPGRRAQFVDRDFGIARRRALFSRQRKSGGVHRAVRHAAATHAGAFAGADASESEVGADRRVRSGRDGGNVRGASRAFRKSRSANSSR